MTASTLQKQENGIQSKRHRRLRRTIVPVGATAVLFILAYLCLGVFVVQPIGAIPEGATVIFWRLNTELPFISSADGILLNSGQQVSLLSRGIVLGRISEAVLPRKIISFPYSRTLYLSSTGGREFDR